MKEKEITFVRKKKRPQGPRPRLRNILNLLYMLLREENEDVNYYAEVLNCSPKTIKSYMQDITHTYDINDEYRIFEIEYDRIKNHYKITTSKDVFVKCSPEEVIALYLAMKYLAGLEGTPLKYLGELEKKLRRYYHESVKPRLNKPVQLSGPEMESKLEEVLRYIDEAMIGKDKKKLIINYTKTYDRKAEKKEIVPYSLIVYDYEWYLRAFCFETEILKTYVINQIEIIDIKALSKEERAKLPVCPDLSVIHSWDWDPKERKPEIVDVKIKFTGRIAEKMRNKLKYRKEHPTQEIEEYEGYVMVTYKVNNPFNMTPWILKAGSLAEVIEPEFLREHIRGEINKLKDLYG